MGQNQNSTIMKKIKQLTTILFLALALVSCNKDDDSNNEAGSGDGGSEYFRAQVDGSGFEADTDLATLIGASLVTNNGLTVLTAQGSTNNGNYINFNIIGYDGVGTYTVADDLTNANMISYGELNGGSVEAWIANGVLALGGNIAPGEIVITSQNDTMAEGTFSFEGLNANSGNSKKTITSGEFKVVFDN